MPKKILYINACVRKNSRTKRLADYLISCLNGETEEIRLEDIHFGISDERFISKRDRLLSTGAYNHPMFTMARSFAAADLIVIAAPFWDLSFPAALKQYIEQINVTGITFSYTPEGVPFGLCKARRLTYITTVGGNYFPEEFGAGYIEALSQNFYGIPEFELIKATGLDIEGADVDEIINTAKKEIKRVNN